MKNKYLIILLAFLFPFVGAAQPGFIKAYDDSIPDRSMFEDMLVENDTLVAYGTSWNASGVQGKRFYKIDSLGNILNQVSYYNDSTGWLLSSSGRKKIIATSDGGYAITGGLSGNTGPTYLLKVNHDLTLDMLRLYPSMKIAAGESLVQLPDDGYMILCWKAIGPAYTEAFIIRTDKDGQEIWRKAYVESEPGVFKGGIDIKKIDDNTYLVFAGRGEIPPFPDQSSWGNAYFFAIDTLGNIKWEWEAKASDNIAMAWDCDLRADGSKVCVGNTWEEFETSPGAYGARPQIFRLDPNGNVVWQHIYSKLYFGQEFRQMVKTPDGNYLATGQMPQKGQVPTHKAMHFKFTPNGDSLWMRLDSVYVTDLNWQDEITGTGLLSSGSIVSVGTAYAAGRYGFMMKLSPNGCIDTLNCWPVATGPEIFDTRQALSVYPNPATDYIVLSKDEGFFHKGSEIEWIDGLGRTIKRVFPQGNTVRMDVGDWASGLYFYRYLLDGRELGVGRVLVER